MKRRTVRRSTRFVPAQTASAATELTAARQQLSTTSPPPILKAERALLWKQDIRIIPLSAGIYFLCFLDRANIGNAKILNYSTGHDMQTEVGMSDYQFVLALLIFLVAYGIFEVPSNILLKKLRPSRWLAILMFTWGMCTILLGVCRTFSQVMAVRWILGMAEAGLFPGLGEYKIIPFLEALSDDESVLSYVLV